MVEFVTLTKEAVLPVMDEVARLRIAIFRDYPYLYDGDMDYERSYLSKLAQSEKSIVVVAKLGSMIVGASTGLPLDDEHDVLRECFTARGMPTSDIFYFAESLLLPRFRGQGAAHKFTDARENWARELGFKKAVFCRVIRPDDHPARPHDYKSLDSFWMKRGYTPLNGFIVSFPWKEVGEAEETPKPMQFWIRDL